MHSSKKSNRKLPQVLIPKEKIAARIDELAKEMNDEFGNEEIVAICTLKGSFIFFSDMIRKLKMPLSCEFLGLSSYGNEKVSSGEVKLTLDIHEPLENRHVVIFEDIVDSGLTLAFIQKTIKARNPKSLRCCSLLVKPDCLKTDVEVDYRGFSIGEEFVVGYGIDYAGKYRELPYLGTLQNEN